MCRIPQGELIAKIIAQPTSRLPWNAAPLRTQCTLPSMLRDVIMIERRSAIVSCLPHQQCRGAKLPSILTVPGRSTTTADHPPSVGRMQPLEALTNRDQRTRTSY